MFGAKVKVTDNTKRVKIATNKAAFKNLKHAVASIRKTVIEDIVASDEPSAPGTPPHTRNRGLTKSGKQRVGQLEKAIAFDANENDAVCGPMASVVGEELGPLMERGGERGGADYPERPFMGPALAKNLDRFHKSWAGSIG